ncbi:OmpA family protein [Fluviicola taffensis]|uniref:OmpA/MotB domain protein n=1 Tax=Fluviicola taffensis (strain DSM 16823 / NCIMB 13979 / RW262) TaxID=755732 RepID=F2IHU3_FLUTR|nr:OmpA family protein [Fluviicola taffensis]AEA45902.1 OmpA/MotB domain protein [Fluviicola taffensis DSM 16823]
MKNKLFILFLIGCPSLFGQDTLRLANQVKVVNIVDRFNQITGPDIHCGDSLKSLLAKMEELSLLNKELTDRNKVLSDTLQKFKQWLYLSDRNFIVEKYGETTSKTTYTDEQYQDFRDNYFLKKFLHQEGAVLVFFPYKKWSINLSFYQEIDDLVNQYFNHKGSSFKINAYSDSHGSEESNLKLSKDRAKFIRNYLINEKKVDARDIQTEGKGSKSKERITEPDLDFMNRRAVIILNKN